MTKYMLLFAAPFLFSANASSQSLPDEPETLAYEPAPGGLAKKEASEWSKLNDQAAKLAKRLTGLTAEHSDDQSDVTEAQDKVDQSQRKLDKEQADFDQTARDIAEVRRDMLRLSERRTTILNQQREKTIPAD